MLRCAATLALVAALAAGTSLVRRESGTYAAGAADLGGGDAGGRLPQGAAAARLAAALGRMSPAELFSEAKRVQEWATEGELTHLRTLLEDRRKWSPEAQNILGEYMEQTSGLCYMHKDESRCSMARNAQCSQCAWRRSMSGTGGYCSDPICGDYADRTACCANEHNIATGCFWSEGARLKPGGAVGLCQAKTCEHVAAFTCDSPFDTRCASAGELCGRFAGCKQTCVGCVDAGLSCSCDDAGAWCFSGSSADDAKHPLALLACAPMDCALCLKSGATSARRMYTAGGRCYEQCKSVVHCDEEAQCLLGTSGGSGLQRSCTVNVTAAPSCDYDIKAKVEVARAPQSCMAQCADFEAACGSCGDASCGETSTPPGVPNPQLDQMDFMRELRACCKKQPKMVAKAQRRPTGSWMYTCVGVKASSDFTTQGAIDAYCGLEPDKLPNQSVSMEVIESARRKAESEAMSNLSKQVASGTVSQASDDVAANQGGDSSRSPSLKAPAGAATAAAAPAMAAPSAAK